MIIFKHIRNCLPATLAVITASGLNAASVELKNGDTLSGDISSFDAKTLKLASKVSYEPLQIDSQAIQRIVLDSGTKDKGVHGERLTLLNGDTLPCKVISLDDKQLRFSTWYAGDFTVARNQIRGIHFGANDQRVIYGGNDALTEWTTREGSWTQTKDNAITCRGSGTLARKLDLPKNLRISYSIAWKGTPNFAFRFCGENKSATTRQDTYEFTLNSAGMQIRRYSGDNRSGAPLANPPLKPSHFSNRTAQLDFHINRDRGEVTLYVDGTKIGTWPDSFDESKGNYIIFNNRSSKNSLTFKDIFIADMNDGSLPRHRESIDKSKSDVFLSSTGDIVSGTILNIENKNAKRILRLKTDKNAKPFEVPESRISSLNFSSADDAPDFVKTDFAALFQTRGQIQLAEPKFTEGFIVANHPILGKCKIDLKAISQFKKQTPEKGE